MKSGKELPAEWPPKEGFVDRLNRLRRARPYSNAEIAKACGLANSNTVSNWQGGQKPEGMVLIRLAKLFDVTPEWLLEGDPLPVATGNDEAQADAAPEDSPTPETPLKRKRKPAPKSGDLPAVASKRKRGGGGASA